MDHQPCGGYGRGRGEDVRLGVAPLWCDSVTGRAVEWWEEWGKRLFGVVVAILSSVIIFDRINYSIFASD
jgi:hypothetical protein